MNRTIEVIVTSAGETKIETKGFAGGACRDASRFIEQALGVATSENLTAEFYQQQSTTQAAKESQA